MDNLRKEWKLRSPVSYSKFKEKIEDQIQSVIEESVETQDGVTVESLLDVSGMSYILSLEELAVSGHTRHN